MQVKCSNCGNALKRPLSKIGQNSFCNHRCRGEWVSRNKAGANAPNWTGGKVEVVCKNCGSTAYRNKGRAQQENHFCSTKCKGEWSRTQTGNIGKQYKGGKITVPCTTCGNPITKFPSAIRRAKRHFCCPECHNKWASEYFKGEGGTNWQGGDVTKPCDYCSKPITRERRMIERNEHIFCSKACRRDWLQENWIGENHPLWEGGRNYYGPNWKEQRQKTKERDGYKCQKCSKHKEGNELHVHHIIPFRSFGYVPTENSLYLLANALENLVSLCSSCHRRIEAGTLSL